MLLAGCPKPDVFRAVGVERRVEVHALTGEWQPSIEPMPSPVGVWMRVEGIEAYVYADLELGLSAQARSEVDGTPMLDIWRLTYAPQQYELVARPAPDWIVDYGPQPPAGTLWGAWRDDPALAHRFHPEFPDDLRVVVGTPRGSNWFYEIVWAGLRGCEGRVCAAALLNQPNEVPMSSGALLTVDFEGVAPDRLSVAVLHGDTPPAGLVALAETAPALSGVLQDEWAWTEDVSLPPEDRLVPLGSYFRIGDDLGYFFYDNGPQAVLLGGQNLQFRSVPWLPRGAEVLSDDAARAAELPVPLPLNGVPEQPQAGPFGTWRLNPAIADLLGGEGHPDRVWVMLDEDTVPVEIFSCAAVTCDAVHIPSGTTVRFGHVRPPGDDVMWTPVAEPLSR